MSRPPNPVFRTKREVALDQLQNAIQLGHYAPGQSLRQFQLVKDRLRALAKKEGLLE